MKFATYSKIAFLPLLAGVLALAGCGASNMSLTPGNWSMTAVPTGNGAIANTIFYVGGNLSQAGDKVSGTMYFVNSNCFSSAQTVTFSGSVKGSAVTLTSDSVGGEVVTVTASGTSSSLSGTYAITGGTTCDGDTGSLTAVPVPSISATWGGPILTQGGISHGGANAALAINITQASNASPDGTFALTGGATFTNSSCSSTGTVSDAFIAGPFLVVHGVTDDGGNFSYTNVLLNNPSSPTSMTGEYSVSGGACNGDLDAPTFTKQQ